MKRVTVAFLLLVGSCVHTSEPALQVEPAAEEYPYPLGPTEVVSGVFTVGFEWRYLVPEGTKEKWWVDSLVDLREFIDKYQGQAYVTFKGRKTELGHYGHLGAYPREFLLEEIMQARPPTQAELLNSK